METLPFEVTSLGESRHSITLLDKSRYYELQDYLRDAGYFVDLETIPPTDEEMGGKTVALILMASLTVEQVYESLHIWEAQHSKPHIELIEPKPHRKEPEKPENKPKDEHSFI